MNKSKHYSKMQCKNGNNNYGIKVETMNSTMPMPYEASSEVWVKLPTTLKLRRTRRRTGKILLLCALICASHMYGMERSIEKWSLPETERIHELPAELQKQIIKNVYTMLQTSDNLKEFTELIHILAAKFNRSTSNGSDSFNMQ